MNEKIGKRIELLIFDMGFLSVKKFAEYLKDKNPVSYVSEDTILNLIKGKGFQNNTLVSIAGGLGVPLDCLTAENMPLVDGYLFNEVAIRKEELKNDINSVHDEEKITNLEIVRMLYDVDKRIYPGEICDRYGFKITTIAEMSIYFPLFSMRNVMEVMYRILGEVVNYENYILEQYAWLYSTIPDIPAKKFADYQVEILNVKSKGEEDKYLKFFYEYKDSEVLQEGYLQYKDIVKRTYELYHNDIMNDIFNAKLPELAY